MLWSFLISFWNTLLICSFLRSVGLSLCVSFTWQAEHVIEIFRFVAVELFSVSFATLPFSFFFLQLIVQFNSMSIKVFSVWMVFFLSVPLFYFLALLSKLMLPIWQVSRKMDIRSTMQRFPSMFCVVDFHLIFLGMNFIRRLCDDICIERDWTCVCMKERGRETKRKDTYLKAFSK